VFGAIAGYPRMRSKFTFSLRDFAAIALGEVPQIQCRRWGGYAAGPACRGFRLATLWPHKIANLLRILVSYRMHGSRFHPKIGSPTSGRAKLPNSGLEETDRSW